MQSPISIQRIVAPASHSNSRVPAADGQPPSFSRAAPMPAPSLANSAIGNHSAQRWSDAQNTRAAYALSALSGYANAGAGMQDLQLPFDFRYGGHRYPGEVRSLAGNLQVAFGDGVDSIHPSQFAPVFEIGGDNLSFMTAMPAATVFSLANQALNALRGHYGPGTGLHPSVPFDVAAGELQRALHTAYISPALS